MKSVKYFKIIGVDMSGKQLPATAKVLPDPEFDVTGPNMVDPNVRARLIKSSLPVTHGYKVTEVIPVFEEE